MLTLTGMSGGSTIIIEPDTPVSVQEKAKENQALIAVSPNPFSTVVEIQAGGKKLDVRGLKEINIYNVKGTLVYSSHIARRTSHVWDASGNPAGIYLVKARIGDQTLTRTVTLIR